MSGGVEAEDEGGGGGPGTNVLGEEVAESTTLNLTALMDILSNLLFFLLACFGATIVMGINATVPVQSSDSSSVADKTQAITAGVALSKAGFDVTAVGSAQSQDELDRQRRVIPLRNGLPDYDALAAHLVAMKQAYPSSDTMILTPEPGTDYETMVKTMDVARESEVSAAGLKRTIPLFPTVVVSTVIK